MQFSLDQRRYNLNMSKKEFYKVCVSKGLKISYSMVCRVFNEPGEVEYKYEKMVKDVLSQLEAKRGITDITF